MTASTTSTVARAASALAPIITATAEASRALATETAQTGKMRRVRLICRSRRSASRESISPAASACTSSCTATSRA